MWTLYWITPDYWDWTLVPTIVSRYRVNSLKAAAIKIYN